MKKEFDIAKLMTKKLKGELSASEQEMLDQWIAESAENQKLLEELSDQQKQLHRLELYDRFDKDRAWGTLEERLPEAKTRSLFSGNWYRYAAAIFLPIVAVAGAYYLFSNQSKTVELSKVDEIVRPGTQKAVLVLADGSNVSLEGEDVPKTIMDSDTEITNVDQQLSYAASTENDQRQALVFNELITPKGGVYDLLLADGTKVWLNADTKLRYPVAFTDTVRQVYLEGEALFQVAHNGKPFKVFSGQQEIEVLGTVFNVSAYQDDAYIQTTLVEGSVKVSITEESPVEPLILEPSQQASLDLDNQALVVEEVNTRSYTNWTEGKFEFDKDNLDQVMKELSRWYDFDYRFQNQEAKGFHFSGRLENSENISVLLEMLQLTTDVKFELDDETIVIQ